MGAIVVGLLLVVVGSDQLARSLDRVYVVMTPRDDPGNVTGPLGLLAAAELELDTDLLVTLGSRETTDREEITSFEVTQRLLGITVGAACVDNGSPRSTAGTVAATSSWPAAARESTPSVRSPTRSLVPRRVSPWWCPARA